METRQRYYSCLDSSSGMLFGPLHHPPSTPRRRCALAQRVLLVHHLSTLLGGVLEDVRNAQGVKLATAKIFGGVALIFTLFAAFLAFQTTTLRFTFDETAFSLVSNDGSSIGDNIKVGGENRWKYSAFQNWAFLPSDDLPLLVYFRETQTPVENRAEAPIVVDNLDGQAHFFPSISNSQQLKEGFLTHGCKKL
jgi:Protein of unknown function (DUF3119)